MSNKPKSRRVFLIILLVAVLAAIITGLYLWQSSRLKTARLEATNPAVFIIDPVQGYSAPTGRWITVLASSTGYRLMESIEIWINGELIEIQESGLPDGVGVIYGHFPLLVQEGAQTFVVRAIDAGGYIGQSDPVSITGYSMPEEDQPYLAVPFNPETDIGMIAFENNISVDELIDLNPDFPFQPEGILRVPVDPAEENTPITPDQIPQDLLTQNGYVSGIICYPSQYIPKMTAYFENTTTGQYTTLPIALNQNTYGISLPPGLYQAYAWLPDYDEGGSYSKAVPCGLTTSCTDHTLIEFQVKAGTNTKGIDICDWYDLGSIPTAPGAPSAPVIPAGPQIASDIPMLTPEKVFPANNNSSLPFAVAIPALPPKSPGNISVRVDQCKVRLGWDTPDSDVDGYTVWFTGQTGNKLLAATLKPGDSSYQNAWYEFISPESGLISVWVEAFNAIGSSASPVATAKVEEKCGPSSSDDFELEALELDVGGNYNNVYLYLSIEGRSEVRLPANDSVFLQVQEGKANFSNVIPGENIYTLEKPKDGDLLIQGECWGWAGGTPVKISSFKQSIPEAQWSGYKKSLGNQDCAVSLNLEPKGSDINEYQTMNNKADVPPPYNVRSERLPKPKAVIIPLQTWTYDWFRTIHWQWKGDIKKITGFSIYYNGKLIATAPANVRSQAVMLPAICGNDINWRVVANGKKGQSPSSPIEKELMQTCPLNVEVVFEQLQLTRTCDSCCCSDQANDTIEAYFSLEVNDLKKYVGTNNFYLPLNVNTYWFSQLVNMPGDIGKDRFVVSITKEPFYIIIAPVFRDYDWGSNDDLWGYHIEHYYFSTFDDALTKFGNPQGTYFPFGVLEGSTLLDDDVWSKLTYRIWVYKTNP